MADEKNARGVDPWALITIVIFILCIFASFWITNTAMQTRFDVLQGEIRNLNEATYREIRSVHRDVLHNRAMIREASKPESMPAMKRVRRAPTEPTEPAEPAEPTEPTEQPDEASE